MALVNVSLKNGIVKQYEAGLTVLEIAKDISEGLARVACAAEIDGKLSDLRDIITKDCSLSILTFDDAGGKWTFRHTASHVMAQAVKRLFPQVKFAIGPAIDDGFYYDFDVDKAFALEDLEKIEKEMNKIVKEDLKLERFTMPRNEAIEFFKNKNEIYKVELIEDLPEGEEISFYSQGEFTDLCAGPHMPSSKFIKAFKLTSAAGAYWRGSEKNKMLCRIYGTAFQKASDLQEHLAAIEEAKRRDHNKLGREMEFFTTSDLIGQGLPILLPKGAKVIQLLQRFVEDEEERRGYLLTKTPFMAKSDLYKISGHWDHYYDGMFVLGDKEKDAKGEEVLALRPMTCPFQFQAYLNRARSYRDLPLRYNETSTLFRNESSGEMHGLIRLRQFTISEGHLACRPDQVEEEFKGCFELAHFFLKTLGLADDISYRFSKWDENNRDKYIGDKEDWENTQNFMRRVLNSLNVPFVEKDGEAAFYGPKLDIQIKNVHGKEDTLVTIQVDFQLAEVFGMTYVDQDSKKKHPIVIHRTSIGCYERTFALLIEKYAGAMPVWLSPVQVKVLPISNKYEDYAKAVVEKLRSAGLRVELDNRTEKIGYKIREARLERTPYIFICGEKEESDNTVSVRSRHKGDEGSTSIETIVERILEEINTKAIFTEVSEQ